MQVFQPSIYIPVPDRWFAKESFTVIAPDGQANVIASSEPLDPHIDTAQYAAVQGDLLRREFPGYRELSFVPTQAFGRSGYVRRFGWHPSDGVPVTQVQMYYAAGGRGYTATATSPTTTFGRFEANLTDVLTGLTID